jgi:hypothetical protein
MQEWQLLVEVASVWRLATGFCVQELLSLAMWSVGSLHLFIFVKNLSKLKPLSREVDLLCTELCRCSLNRSDGTGLILQFRYQPFKPQ